MFRKVRKYYLFTIFVYLGNTQYYLHIALLYLPKKIDYCLN